MSQNFFKWKDFESEIIILCVRWYLKYPLSYRMLVEMMQERKLNLTHTTIMRWVHQYSPIISEKLKEHLKPTNDSWRMDETYLKIKGKNAYLYRAVDSQASWGQVYILHISNFPRFFRVYSHILVTFIFSGNRLLASLILFSRIDYLVISLNTRIFNT